MAGEDEPQLERVVAQLEGVLQEVQDRFGLISSETPHVMIGYLARMVLDERQRIAALKDRYEDASKVSEDPIIKLTAAEKALRDLRGARTAEVTGMAFTDVPSLEMAIYRALVLLLDDLVERQRSE